MERPDTRYAWNDDTALAYQVLGAGPTDLIYLQGCLVEIAELLGVTKQRAHQIAKERGFPAPLAEDARGRVWSRNEVQAWAKVWRRGRPWR